MVSPGKQTRRSRAGGGGANSERRSEKRSGRSKSKRTRNKHRLYRPPDVRTREEESRDPTEDRYGDRYGGGGGAWSPASDVAVSASEGPPDKVYCRSMIELVPNPSNLTESIVDENAMRAHYYHHHSREEPRQPQAIYHLSRPSMGNRTMNSGEIKRPSPIHRLKLNQWYEKKRFSISPRSRDSRSVDDSRAEMSHALSSNEHTVDSVALGSGNVSSDGLHDVLSDAEDDFLKTKQQTAYLSIGVTSIQLLILMLQLTMCGVASLDVNPMVGPFPDAFSLFGGKNAYLMLTQNEWWRLVTPSFLHVGVLHLLANAFCQLETVALFEREWGSFRWLLLYLLSSAGCGAFSSYFDPDTIGVGSSGTLMGMYAAKLAQVMSHTCFTVGKGQDDAIRLDQMSGVLCGLTLVSLLSSFTYIDWSGHMGGLAIGFLSGMFLFCRPIDSCCARFFWASVGILGMFAALAAVLYYFITTSQPDEEMADACQYFRNLFPEDYECGCMWQ